MPRRTSAHHRRALGVLSRRSGLTLVLALVGSAAAAATAIAVPAWQLNQFNNATAQTTLRGNIPGVAPNNRLVELENLSTNNDSVTLSVIGHSGAVAAMRVVNIGATGRGLAAIANRAMFADTQATTGETRAMDAHTASPDGFAGFFRNETAGVGTSGIGIVALGRDHTHPLDTGIGPDGFDAAIEAAGPNGIEGNSHSAGGFGVSGDGPAVGVNGTATAAGGRGGNFTAGPSGIGVDANGGDTGLQATGDTFAVDADANAAGGIAGSFTTGASANDAVQGNTSGGISDAIQGTTTGGAAFSIFGIASGGGTAGVFSGGTGGGVSASNSNATTAAGSFTNSLAGGTAGSFTGDTGVSVNSNDAFSVGLDATVTGNTDGAGTADDDGNQAINAATDDVNSPNTLQANNSGVPSDAFTAEAIEAFGFVDINGSARVTGDLEVVGICCGPVIDNPDDPAGSYLRHAGVSSSEMKNMYDGVVTTDDNGEATVTLPDYFGALNRDPLYQLTVIGDSFAQAIVSDEIDAGGSTFAIKTSEPGIKVSWQVTGVRNDPYAKAHPLQVIEQKTGKAAGQYLHPELYGRAGATPLGVDGRGTAGGAATAAAEADLAKLIARKVRQAKADADQPAPEVPKQPKQ